MGSAVYHYCTDDLSTAQRVSVPVIYLALWTFWTYCVLVVWSYYAELATRAHLAPGKDKGEEEEEAVPIVHLADSRYIKCYQIRFFF